jgi:hypothetical protein
VRRYWIAGVVASSLALAACGASATIDQAISSIGASPNLQVHLTASATGAKTAQAQSVLRALSLDMSYSSASGGALAQSQGHVNSELVLNSGNRPLLDTRQVDSNLYLWVDVSALAAIPGVKVGAQQLAAAQLLVGDRWFEIPAGLVTSYLPTTTISAAQRSKELAAAQAIIDALSKLIESTPYSTIANGYSQTGTLSSVVGAVLPAIEGLAGRSITPGPVKGTYTIDFTMSGADATSASLAITAPNGTAGDATIALHATLSHDAQSVQAPSGATVVTRSMIDQLLLEARSVPTTSSGLG